jgi:zinc transport system permease protein
MMGMGRVVVIEALSYPFMQRAIIAGVLIAALGGYYGTFIVQRKLSFLGSGLAHAAFGGVALGLLLLMEPLLVALPFTVLVAIGITWLKERTRIEGDTAVGIFFAVSVALGVIFLSLRTEYTGDAYAYLFGSILAVQPTDLLAAFGVLMLTLFSSRAWGRWAYATFDKELARVDRLNLRREEYILSVLVALTIVIAVKMMGIVLVSAFLVIPAATARQVAVTFWGMTLYSVLFGVLGTLVGLWLSYLFDFPSGATIVLALALGFSIASVLRRK